MPGFKKDYMTMPDQEGNQWARTGGLFGRNRVTSAPSKAKQAPAPNANPFVQAVNPLGRASLNMKSTMVQNPFVNKTAAMLQSVVAKYSKRAELSMPASMNPNPLQPPPQQAPPQPAPPGMYPPGEGPVTSQVPPQGQQQIMPSPTMPQPMQADQSGQFPPMQVQASVKDYMNKVSDQQINRLFK